MRNENKLIIHLWKYHQGDDEDFTGHLSIEIPTRSFYRSLVKSNNLLSSSWEVHDSYQADKTLMKNRDSDKRAIFYSLRIDDIIALSSQVSDEFLQEANEKNKNSRLISEDIALNYAFYVRSLLAQGEFDQLTPTYKRRMGLRVSFIVVILCLFLSNIKNKYLRILTGIIALLAVLVGFYTLIKDRCCSENAYYFMSGARYFNQFIQPIAKEDNKRNKMLPTEEDNQKRLLSIISMGYLGVGIAYIVLAEKNDEILFWGYKASLALGIIFIIGGSCLLCVSLENETDSEALGNKQETNSNQRVNFNDTSNIIDVTRLADKLKENPQVQANTQSQNQNNGSYANNKFRFMSNGVYKNNESGVKIEIIDENEDFILR